MRYLWLVAFIPLVIADDGFTWDHQFVSNVRSCESQLGDVEWCNDTLIDSGLCFCNNTAARASFVGCLKNHKGVYKNAVRYAISECWEDYNVSLTQADVKASLAYFNEHKVPFENLSDYMVDGFATVPVYMNKTVQKLYDLSFSRYYNNYDYDMYFSFALMGYWMFVLLMYSMNTWMKALVPSVFVRAKSSKLLNAAKRHLFMAPSFGSKRLQVSGKPGSFFQMLMPTRIEVVILIVYLGLSIAFISCDVHFVKGDPLLGNYQNAVESYMEDRTGILATMCMPMLILFGGRNNFLQWITGVKFSAFIFYHKWIARMFLVLVLIHAGCQTLDEYDIAGEYLLKYLRLGTLATLATALIMVQSLMFLRRRWYEIFLLVHILLAIMVVAGTWRHVIDEGYVWFLYITSGIWAFDRIIRLLRLVLFGFPVSQMTLFNGDMIKLEVPTRKWYKQSNGGHSFVSFLTKSKFMQSHPFSPLELGDKIIFYIKVKEGITHSLSTELSTLPEMTKNIRVAVEGPYGGGLELYNVKNYHSAVFIAGGNAIPGMFSSALKLVVSKQRQQRVKLVWIIRDYNALNWFWDELSLNKGSIELDVYVSRPETKLLGRVAALEDNEDGSKKDKEVDDDAEAEKGGEGQDAQLQRIVSNFTHVNFMHGRPNVQQIVSGEVELSGTSLALVACGNPQMVDDVRLESIKEYDGKRVDFYEHLQVWA